MLLYTLSISSKYSNSVAMPSFSYAKSEPGIFRR